MARHATVLTLLLFLLALLTPLPTEAAPRMAVIKVKGMTCDS